MFQNKCGLLIQFVIAKKNRQLFSDIKIIGEVSFTDCDVAKLIV